MRIDEFAPEKKWWAKRKETDQAWKVSIEDIKARGYNLDIKNPRAVDDGPGDPDELLKQYREAAAEVDKVRRNCGRSWRRALEDKTLTNKRARLFDTFEKRDADESVNSRRGDRLDHSMPEGVPRARKTPSCSLHSRPGRPIKCRPEKSTSAGWGR